MKDSIFTKIIRREIPATIVEESDTLIVIKDINPQAAIHLLIITKKPIVNIQVMNQDDFSLAADVFKMAQQLSKTIPEADQFRLLINNGFNAGQRVFHFHAHFLAG